MLIVSKSSKIAAPRSACPSYLTLYNIRCGLLSTSAKTASGSEYRRSEFQGQPFTGEYEPGQPTRGPLATAAKTGAPRVTPKLLKEHLDKFVVGQERPKKVLSVAVYNHYQRIQELRRQEEEEEERLAKAERMKIFETHPVETEYPGQIPTVSIKAHLHEETPESRLHAALADDTSPSTIEKSNILMLGPSGVGKTLMVKTLARVLDVPFSMSDCTPFTQAGYIGEDADLCVQRLFAAADYNVARTENGIICLDEFDKIATSKVSHGKDVSGEGVQQALLKLIEGTTIQITAKAEKAISKGSAGGFGMGNGLGSATGGAQPKTETYNIRTDNILFICTGAFVNLQKLVLDRVAKGSLGFGAPVRASSATGNDVVEKPDAELFKKHMPFWSADPSSEIYNPLDLVEPSDLQKYGMIPELIGRIPITIALSKLDLEALVRVLTEPRNSLVQQFIALFQTYGIELRFTSPALRAIAEAAVNMGTGARGLRKVMENVTFYAMYHGPGSSVKHVLITKDVAKMKSAPIMLARGQAHKFHAIIAEEEEKWEKEREDALAAENMEAHDFAEFREQAKSGM